jgi:hypothetical protein
MRYALGRRMARWFGKRSVWMRNARPIISFTFDDFPTSAYTGTEALFRQAGVHATFYTSIGLLGRTAPTGEIASPELFREVLSSPHEVGCHTFDHLGAFETPSDLYRISVERNLRELRSFDPLAKFDTHSYPISFPRMRTKRYVGNRFQACRAGGQIYNQGALDLAYLQSFFIERSRSNPTAIREQIERSVQANGWLIFSTHDVDDNPTVYGCTPALFASILEWSIASGALILPVRDALAACGIAGASMIQGGRSI